jgi:hypothetical protein
MPEPDASSASSVPSATSPDLAPADSATPSTTPPAKAPKARHQETASSTGRGPSQAQACDQAKRGADAASLNKCGAGRAVDKSFAPCSCSGSTAIITCTALLTVMCEDK